MCVFTTQYWNIEPIKLLAFKIGLNKVDASRDSTAEGQWTPRVPDTEAQWLSLHMCAALQNFTSSRSPPYVHFMPQRVHSSCSLTSCVPCCSSISPLFLLFVIIYIKKSYRYNGRAGSCETIFVFKFSRRCVPVYLSGTDFWWHCPFNPGTIVQEFSYEVCIRIYFE